MIFPTQPLEMKEKRGPLVGAVLGSFAFVAMAFFMAFVKEGSLFEQILLGFCGLVFLLFAFVGIYRLTRPPLVIRLDADGLHTDAIPGAPMISVPWNRVTGVRLWQAGPKPLVVVDVTDGDALLGRASKGGKGLLKANKALAGSPFAFYPPSFGMSTEEFFENIRGRQQHFNPPPPMIS